MPTYILPEAYGAYGSANEVAFRTTVLSSCSAIIFHRAATNTLGLFHYPSGTLGNAAIQAAIVSMINDISPTRMMLWASKLDAADPGFLYYSIIADNDRLETFLKGRKEPTCVFERAPNATFPGVRVAAGALSFDGVDAGDKLPALPDGRSQQGNIVFHFVKNSKPDESYGKEITRAAEDLEEAAHDARRAARRAAEMK